MNKKRLAILGSTGSIGQQTLDSLPDLPAYKVCALAARSSGDALVAQAKQHHPAFVAATAPSDADALKAALPEGTTLLVGEEAMCDLIRETHPDVVVCAVVGAAGVKSTITALQEGCCVALANKEALVCAGEIVTALAAEKSLPLLPVDSEHSGLLQCMLAGRRDEIRHVTITASGGSLRDLSDADAENASVDDVLNHPTWEMGPKITVDSATMINKALEVIEAHWLFGLEADDIDVVIHPQSIVHAMVEFHDGSVIAQLARPDMKLPIAYALAYPDRPARDVAPLDLPSLATLDFQAVTGRSLRPIALAKRVIREGGAAGAVLNAANEVAVEAFLSQREGDKTTAIRFGQIVPLVEDALDAWLSLPESHQPVTLDHLLNADAWARQFVAHAIRP